MWTTVCIAKKDVLAVGMFRFLPSKGVPGSFEGRRPSSSSWTSSLGSPLWMLYPSRQGRAARNSELGIKQVPSLLGTDTIADSPHAAAWGGESAHPATLQAFISSPSMKHWLKPPSGS